MLDIHILTPLRVIRCPWHHLWWKNGLGQWYATLFYCILLIITLLYWSQYDGTTSSNSPPHSQTFDPINRRSSVVPSRRLASTSAPSHVPSSLDESALASISQILSSFASIAQTQSSSPSRQLPSTPSHSQVETQNPITPPPAVLSSIINTPSKLSRFLTYAEAHLGIPNARLYERCLEEMGYGPDILHLVDDSSLKDIGIKPGDVIRLKQHSLQWLNSSASKRKQSDHTSSTSSTPPNKRVRFEKRFHDGGLARLYGPRIVKAEGDELDSEKLLFDWFYHCKVRDAWLPVPSGCVPVLDDDDNFWIYAILVGREGSLYKYTERRAHTTQRAYYKESILHKEYTINAVPLSFVKRPKEGRWLWPCYTT